MDAEYDPSTIFHFTRDNGEESSTKGFVKIETQGLTVSENQMIRASKTPQEEELNATSFEVQDIGQTAFQIRTKGNTTGENAEKSYLSYDPTNMKYALNAEADELDVAEGIVNGSTVTTHDTKWLLEPNFWDEANRSYNTAWNDWKE